MFISSKISARLKIIAGIIAFTGLYFAFVSGSNSREAVVADKSYPKVYADAGQLLTEKKRNHVEEYFRHLRRKNVFNGNILYAEKGEVVYEACIGYGDLKHNEMPLSTGSAFQLASVSKMFTATAIMILKEEGKLDYDDSVNKYVFGFPYKDVTIRHLLTHRSGLPRYMPLADKYWDRTKTISNRDVVGLLIRYHPAPSFSPGKGFHYCNTNYALLACIVEAVSKIGFDKFVKSRIFIPAGMTDSFVYNHTGMETIPGEIPGGVPGHEISSRGFRQIGDNYLNGVMGDKGVYSTVRDLFRFDSALRAEIIVSAETLEEAFSPGSPARSNNKDNYGFGWRIRHDMDSTVYHFGWWKGFRTYFIRDLAQERSLIVLCNNTRGISSSLLWDLIKENDSALIREVYHELSQRHEKGKAL
ncbi:MAG: beta-lactamase family protein [Bacteroidales bacterium]|nr:beta-lactamase family protein [Bacteroidales bacterium]